MNCSPSGDSPLPTGDRSTAVLKSGGVGVGGGSQVDPDSAAWGPDGGFLKPVVFPSDLPLRGLV